MEELSFMIQGDSEGYVTFECPFCHSEFKLQAGEFQDDDNPVYDLWCPYCGLTADKNNFLSQEVKAKAEEMAYNYMVEEINKAFGKMARNINRSKGIIKMTYKPLKKMHGKDIVEKDTVETPFECSCCNRHTKILYGIGKACAYCAYCGVTI